MLTITHTPEDGTTVEGTSKGDGSNVVVKRYGFRWSRTGGTWFLRNTRGRPARTYTIEECAKALREAGFEVTVDVDNGTAEQRAEALDAHRERRAEALDAKAERLAAEASAHSEASHAATAGIPFGQPILVGHHSERRHRRAIERSDNAMRKAVDTHRASEDAAGRAQTARYERERSQDPAFIGRRIADKERNIRDYERKLNGTSGNGMAYGQKAEGAYRERIEGLLAEARDELAHWQEQLEATGAKVYTRDDIKPGDLVKIRHGWSKVVRANPKTVACDVGMPWPLKYPYSEIKGHKRPEEEAA